MNNDLQFEIWRNSKIQKSENHSDEEISSCSSLRSCKLLLKMLNYLQDVFNNRSAGVCTDEKMNDIVDMIKVEHLDDNKKIAFLSEQLSLVFSSPNGRRYSPSLIAMSYMRQSVSPALYKQLEGVLTLPPAKYIRNISSSVGDDCKLTQPAKRYLSARFQKLKETDHEVSLIMDEVYCQNKVQYSNGMFYGMEGNEITKTLLCLMIKSICGIYIDVISMIPITNINATILYTIWESKRYQLK